MQKKLGNEAKILSVLQQILDEQRGNANFQLLKTQDESLSADLVRYVSSLSTPLEKVLQEDPLFNSENPLMIASGENGSTSFDAERVARMLIKKTSANLDSREAVDWLSRVLSTTSANGFHVMTISDLEITLEIEFQNGVKLMPLNLVPYSLNTEFLLGKNYSRWGASGASARPTAALVLPTFIEYFFYNDEEHNKAPEEDVFRSYKILDKARLALSAVGPCCPVNAGFWFCYEEKDLEDATFSASRMTKMLDIQAPAYGRTRAIDLEQAKITVDGFFQLDSELESRCTIALERLNQSIRRSASRGDKCLDLAMALEALLVNDSGEHSYKISLRSALIAGTTIDEKLRIRAIAKALYDIRSKLVHTGKESDSIKLPYGLGIVRTNDLIDEAEDLVSKVLRVVISKRKLPNWFEYELGSNNT